MARKVLFVVTSNQKLGDTGRKTGVHFDELATPYYVLQDAGIEVEIASPQGGAAPIDNQAERGENPANVERFLDDQYAMDKLKLTKRLDQVLAEGYLGVFLPGGHGTMWDLPHDARLGPLLAKVYEAGKPVAAVCHGPAGFVGATRSDGRPLIQGKKVNCFSDDEEKAVELENVVPFLLESKLRELGAEVETADKFTEKVVEDGNLITGQNPMSAQALAERLLEQLKNADTTEQAA
ncbi:type 1 glutamine amidotransferase domain-containing protein [Rhodovibrio salinarum]|uniref:Type 1 glutamine amidotransferase domain-containing protein n=1 Tax=Rhodovibrio salinarum TaxID=1087 RepID=A0A934QLI6_9PROT|nr:type 1 glutamine amidotransferase domain-containing protein [Rhodovibrio salinarum]MBK1698739.1 type 1 glutamine amidotransferase domain-containing protein [Rhodovibrio salinarum]